MGKAEVEVPSIVAGEAAQRVRDGAMLLDVREPSEWEAGHAELAHHIPLGQLGASVAQLPRDRQIVAVCRSGGRSGAATKALIEQGFDAINLEGGMQSWEASGLPVLTDGGLAGTVA